MRRVEGVNVDHRGSVLSLEAGRGKWTSASVKLARDIGIEKGDEDEKY